MDKILLDLLGPYLGLGFIGAQLSVVVVLLMIRKDLGHAVKTIDDHEARLRSVEHGAA